MHLRNKKLFSSYIKRASIALAGGWMLVACSPDDNAFSEFETLQGAEWRYTDSLSFTPAHMADSIVEGTLLVAVRHTRGYRYRNIWLELSWQPVGEPDSSTRFVRDTVNLELADAYGRWLGHGSGASFMREDTAARRFVLRKGGELRLRHIMRLDTLPDIEQAGVVFIPD